MSITNHSIIQVGEQRGEYLSVMIVNNKKSTPLYNTNVFIRVSGDYVEDDTVKTGRHLSVINGVVTYVGKSAKTFEIAAFFDMVCTGIGKKFKFQFFKNGVAVNSPVERYVSTGIDIGAAAICSSVRLKNMDTIEFKSTCTNSTTDLTVKNLFMTIKEIA